MTLWTQGGWYSGQLPLYSHYTCTNKKLLRKCIILQPEYWVWIEDDRISYKPTKVECLPYNISLFFDLVISLLHPFSLSLSSNSIQCVHFASGLIKGKLQSSFLLFSLSLSAGLWKRDILAHKHPLQRKAQKKIDTSGTSRVRVSQEYHDSLAQFLMCDA